MGRPRKTDLTKVDKKYIDLFVAKAIETRGEVTERDFELMASELEKDVQLVKDHANIVVSKQEPQFVEQIPVSPLAPIIRKRFSPREGMSMIDQDLSEMIDKNPASFIKRTRNDGAIYRGNKKSD